MNQITEEIRKEVEELAVDHKDALVAYGADMFQQGMVRGAGLCALGVISGMAITELICCVIEKVKTRKKNKEVEKINSTKETVVKTDENGKPIAGRYLYGKDKVYKEVANDVNELLEQNGLPGNLEVLKDGKPL